MSEFPIVRFVAKVDATGECWEWTGKRQSAGYGVFRLNGRVHTASRALWLMLLAPIPEGIEIAHRCDNRTCVRPTHLFLATHGENMADMRAKGRSVNPPGVRLLGADNPAAKLSAADVLAIRASTLTDRALADTYGISHQSVSRIRRRARWAHVA